MGGGGGVIGEEACGVWGWAGGGVVVGLGVGWGGVGGVVGWGSLRHKFSVDLKGILKRFQGILKRFKKRFGLF